jgi:hypothetical protein
MNEKPLRLAVLLPGPGPTRHQAEMVTALRGMDAAVTVFSAVLPRRAGGLLLSLYQGLDRLLSPVSLDPFAPARLPGGVRELPGTDWAAGLARAARTDGLDLLVVPGSLDLPPGLAAAFRLGALVLKDADLATHAPSSALCALAGPDPYWEPRLVWHAPGRPPRVLYASPSAVFPLSLRQTAAPACVKAARFVPRMARLLLDHGPAAWEARARDLPEPPFPAPPGDAFLLGLLARLAGRYLAAAWRSVLYKPQWFLALRRGGGDPFDPRGFAPLFPPDASGWADPFPFVHAGLTHLFFEHIHKDTGLGSIAVMTETPDGGFDRPQTVLSAPHHLSYPFVFAWRDGIYMVPESGQAGRVDLFRATRFPLEWERAATLLDGVRAVDSTLFEHEGRWWLFANLRQEGGSSWDELSIFHAATPLGPFSPHPGNPVVSDVRAARPAGRVFHRDGRLYRPAQDCSGHYGRGLAIREIELLTPDDYRESTAVRHGADILGVGDSLHTYTFVPGLETVDGRRFLPRLAFLRRRPSGGRAGDQPSAKATRS